MGGAAAPRLPGAYVLVFPLVAGAVRQRTVEIDDRRVCAGAQTSQNPAYRPGPTTDNNCATAALQSRK